MNNVNPLPIGNLIVGFQPVLPGNAPASGLLPIGPSPFLPESSAAIIADLTARLQNLEGAITLTAAATNTGAISWTATWIPLDAGAVLASA